MSFSYDDPRDVQSVMDTLWDEYNYLRKNFWDRLKILSKFSFYMFISDFESARKLLAEVSNPLDEHGSYYYSFTEGLTKHIKNTRPEYESYVKEQDPKRLAQSVFKYGQYPNYSQGHSRTYVRPLVYDSYQHYKGGNYLVLCTAVEENTLIPFVQYHSIETGLNWGRTLEDWRSEVTLPDGTKVPRFSKT